MVAVTQSLFLPHRKFLKSRFYTGEAPAALHKNSLPFSKPTMLWPQSKNRKIRMGAMKNYLLTLLQHCSEEKFGQDAIEWAIVQGHVTLTYDLEKDVRQIMGNDPNGGRDAVTYDRIIQAYRRAVSEHGEALVEIYRTSGLLEEILRPIPLAVAHQSKPELIGK